MFAPFDILRSRRRSNGRLWKAGSGTHATKDESIPRKQGSGSVTWWAVVGAFSWILVTAGYSQTTRYTVQDLGTFGSVGAYDFSIAWGVNNAGQVAGASSAPSSISYAFLYSGGSLINLGTLGGSPPHSAGKGINNLGQVTGESQASTGHTHAFFYSGGSMIDLGTLGGEVSGGWGVNSSGQVTGQAATVAGFSHAFLYSGGSLIDLGTLGGSGSIGYDINDLGQVTGRAQVSGSGAHHAFLYSAGTMIDLGTLGGFNSSGTAINNSGQVAGNSDTSAGQRAFLYSGGHMIDLGTLGGSSSGADGINDLGQVTGSSTSTPGGTAFHAFLYSDGRMYDLNDLIPEGSGWFLSSGLDINDTGQIVGNGFHNGVRRAFLASPVDAISISLRSVSPSAPGAISNLTAGVDEPLQLMPSEDILKSQPSVAKGLVADGVTPLLFEIKSGLPPNQPATYKLVFDVSSANPSAGTQLAQNLRVLQSGSFVNGDTVTLSGEHPQAFAYITGVETDEFFWNGEHQSTVTLKMQDAASAVVATKTFVIRAPPVALVHGYNADKDSWSEEFLNELRRGRGDDDFVIPIEYGVQRQLFEGAPKFIFSDKKQNTRGALPELAALLDTVLVDNVERSSGALSRSDWAFTRYDVVGHSQGGVLLRMLCASSRKYSAGQQLFYSGENLYRGRFRRVVTIGSPHNGSLFLAWTNALNDKRKSPFTLSFFTRALLLVADLLQQKFDPFEHTYRHSQIHEVNRTPIDPRAKFHLLQFTTTGGDAPLAPLSAPFINATGLDERVVTDAGEHTYKYAFVFPRGSDGIVERSSQGAGNGSPITFLGGLDYPVSHAGPAWVFGVPSGSTETGLPRIADSVLALLNDDDTVFGRFENPVSRPSSEYDSLLKLAGTTDEGQPLAVTALSGLTTQQLPATAADRHFILSLPPAVVFAPDTSVFWTVGILTPTGFSTDGVTVEPDSANPLRSTVVVDSSVIGDVVASASYYQQDGTFVVTKPALVVSASPPPAALRVYPEGVTVQTNGQTILDVYAIDETARIFPSFFGDTRVTFQSEDPSIANVDADGVVSGQAQGSTVVHVSFRGLQTDVPVTVTPLPARLGNISTRLRVQTGDSVLIGGFILTGAQPKTVIVRGIGPSLPMADKLANPTLELRDSSGVLLDSNDDWQQSPNKQAIIDSTIAPTNALESAIVATLPAGNAGYTAIVRGKDNGTGIGVVEAYDLDPSADSKLANISTRGLVQTDDNVLIAGTILLGNVSQKVIVRAIGPSLTGLGVSGALQDPNLELRDGNGSLVRSNDNWRSDQEAEIIATTIPPSHNLESAIVTTLPSNGASYTAIVRGVNDTIGIAVVEVYGLN